MSSAALKWETIKRKGNKATVETGLVRTTVPHALGLKMPSDSISRHMENKQCE